MCASPARSTELYSAQSDGLDAHAHEIEQRLERLRREEEQHILRFEEKLLDDSARRINDFERRLEHEWLALRALHEDQLKTVEQRTIDIAGKCVGVVQEALSVIRTRDSEAANAAAEVPEPQVRASTIVLATALVVVTVLSAYTTWRLSRDLQAVSARAAASDARIAEMRQFVERQTRSAGEVAQRLGTEALAAASVASRLAAVLAATDVGVYPLRGQAVAAAATGQVFLSASRGIVLSASRMPRLAPNQTYQLWMTTTRGPVSLGFVEPDSQNSVDAPFESVPPQEGSVIGFMLTIEPMGGSERPTGPVALMS